MSVEVTDTDIALHGKDECGDPICQICCVHDWDGKHGVCINCNILKSELPEALIE